MNVEPSSPAKEPTTPSERAFIPHQPTIKQKLIAWIIYTVIRTIAATLRYRWGRDPRTLPQEGRPYIFCTWHNRLPLSLIMYRQFVESGGQPFRLAAIVSASRDGAVLTRILELFNVRPARGSSSRRGAQVLLELATCAEQGFDLAFAPDGPRGPIYEMKPGVITLASMTGRPLVPASYHLGSKITLKSWDRFQIPLPFSKCTFNFGDPVPVPRELSEEGREKIRQQFQTTLNALTSD
jgi:hypothetical protein